MFAAQDRSVLFDPWAEVYAVIVPWMWHYPWSDTERWVSQSLRGRQRILDAGTGPGYWLAVAARDEPRQLLAGIDISDAFLAVARQRLAGIDAKLYKKDIAYSGFGSGAFDAIVCAGVIDTVPDPGRLLSEFDRMLAENGVLLLVVRSGNTFTSRCLEVLFRLLAGLGHAWQIKSLKGFRLPSAMWQRSPILPRLEDLLLPTSLSGTEVERKRLWTVVRLTKVVASNATKLM
jgi:SAM-dependent methyltransferase